MIDMCCRIQYYALNLIGGFLYDAHEYVYRGVSQQLYFWRCILSLSSLISFMACTSIDNNSLGSSFIHDCVVSFTILLSSYGVMEPWNLELMRCEDGRICQTKPL